MLAALNAATSCEPCPGQRWSADEVEAGAGAVVSRVEELGDGVTTKALLLTAADASKAQQARMLDEREAVMVDRF